MIIKEAILNNFGRFQNQRISFQEGINVVYGANESGKTTLHTFLRGIFFGLPRKRGLASKTDTYTSFRPWENPAWYEGALIFQCGGKSFRLERDFSKPGSPASLYCQTDGEQLSVEDGDLEMLLGNLTETAFENTVYVGQLKSRTQEGLLGEVGEYLRKYQAGGELCLDVEKADKILRETGRQWKKKEEELLQERRNREERLQYQIRYQRQEMQSIREKLSNLEEERGAAESSLTGQEREENKSGAGQGYTFIPAVLGVLFFALAVAAGMLFHPAWLVLAFLCLGAEAGLYLYTRQEKQRRQRRAREQKRQRQQEKAARIKGRKAALLESLGEKEIMAANLQEELEEQQAGREELEEIRKEIDSIVLARDTLKQAAASLQSRTGKLLRQEISGVLEEITQGKYRCGGLAEDGTIFLDCRGESLRLHQVSCGTVEQVYFALRMACGGIFSREEELPVFLDETFAMYDDKRLSGALKWLSRNKTQTILFTCNRREIEALEALDIPFRLVQL